MTPPRDARSLAAGVGVVAAQGVGLLAGGVYLTVRSVTSHVNDLTVDVFGIVLAFLAGLVVLWLARSLLRGFRFPRTPVYLFEFLTFPIGVGLLQGHQWGWGVVVLGSGLASATLVWRGLPRPGEG